ncbi:MAG TPA: NAD-dependent epimerase/dehydratase family protein [Mycobacteriales bacterium]|jgi:uncharacterized protein YbjT (DUF2867 family)|nr:NAD-dependent epimerase/dehydratase family protein [Mycobacteriales bacterium]
MSGRVLVTGGTGYIGGWCVAELLRRGCPVRTTARRPEAARAGRPGDAGRSNGTGPA